MHMMWTIQWVVTSRNSAQSSAGENPLFPSDILAPFIRYSIKSVLSNLDRERLLSSGLKK